MTDYYKDKQQMTDEQIAELAPYWATHYEIATKAVTFFDVNDAISFNFETGKMTSKFYNEIGIQRGDKPIPRKKFNISGYEFDYGEFTTCIVDGGELTVCDGKGHEQECKTFSKKDVVAMAKSLGVTAEDLK